jgi:hypothetical protein
MNGPWRTWPVTRVAASFLSWALFIASFGVLFQIALAVMALGGYCASGGPYVIAVECPDNAWLAPVSIWVGIGAVLAGIALTAGFGTPVVGWAWTILFVGLGGAFLASFVTAGDIVGLIVGVMFVVMGLVPFVFGFRTSAQRMVLGQMSARGEQFLEGPRARTGLLTRRTPNPDTAITPTAAHWALGVGVPLLGVAAGLWTASALV